MTINVNIKSSSDKKFVIAIDTDKTVLDLKNAIAEQTEVPAERQRLIYSGRVLKDPDTLADCKVADGNTIHMVKGGGPKAAAPAASGNAAAAASAATPAAAAAAPATANPASPTNNSQTTQAPNANPFGGFAGMPADSQSNPFNMFGSGFGAGAMGNSFGAMDPNMTNQMLQNPMFAQYMSNVLQNPAVLDSIIQTNPQLSGMGPEIRNMMQSPEFRQMLSTLDNCVMLGASSVIHPTQNFTSSETNCDRVCGAGVGVVTDDNGSIPESFYTNGGLKLRVVWTISSLIAASARHYLLQPIIAEHKTLDSLVLTDADRQGVLCMNKEQLEELRVKPLSASSASKRTLVPALNMKLWYAPFLELPNGTVLKGATLVAIRPSEQSTTQKEVSDGSWVSSAFEEPYGTAARMLVKRRTYCLEMNSF